MASLSNLTSQSPIVVDCSQGNAFIVTPTEDTTISAVDSSAGESYSLIVITSGTTPYTLTFGAGIRSSSPTLSTGSTDASYLVIEFISDGINLIEKLRTSNL